MKLTNCLKYDIETEPKNSTYLCRECIGGYYVFNGVCAKRSSINQCLSFVVDDDICEKCGSGYYLSEDKKNCVIFPKGVQGCQEYISESECKLCKDGYYIKNQRCVLVPSENKIPFCQEYSTTIVCVRCISGFYLSQGQCEKASVTSCLEYQDLNNCKICESPFGLKLINGKSKCIVKEIPFCNKSTDYYPFKCTQCQKLYYPKNGTCQPISNAIDFCNEYETENTCKFCNTSSTLSLDRSTCIKNETIIKSVDSGCQYNTIVKPYCNTCKSGFFLSKNMCQSCIENGSYEEGCAFCDVQNLRICLLCRSGYYYLHSIKGCSKTIIEEPEPTSVNISTSFLILITFISVLIS